MLSFSFSHTSNGCASALFDQELKPYRRTADPTPFISGSDDTNKEEEPPKLVKHHPSLDSMIERSIEEFGWAQFMQAVVLFLAWVFDAQQTFLTIFTDAQPTWHCTDRSDPICNSVASLCRLDDSSSWQWDLPKHVSIISDWGLQCSSSLVQGLPASSFFAGCMVGGFLLATLADSSLGRKNMLLLSCAMMSFSAFLTVFSTNVWMYSCLRFVAGFGRASLGTCALVLSSEIVSKRYRAGVGIALFLGFTLGFLSLPAIAYLNRGSSWRVLYIWTSVPAIVCCALIHFMVRESPRWLFVRGRREEAIENLKGFATTSADRAWSFSAISLEGDPSREDISVFSTIKVLLEKKWACRRLCAVILVGFGTGMAYYGMPLAVGNLNYDLYTSVTLNALSELPSTLIIFLLFAKFNRKSSLSFFTTLSGICSIMCLVKGQVWEKLQISMELIAFFSGCTALDILLMYTLELFPTCVRNSALALVRQAAVFGGVVSPTLVAASATAGGRGDGVLSYGVFGLVIGCCGVFVMWLPETRGGNLSDTMDEEEQKESMRATLDGAARVNV